MNRYTAGGLRILRHCALVVDSTIAGGGMHSHPLDVVSLRIQFNAWSRATTVLALKKIKFNEKAALNALEGEQIAKVTLALNLLSAHERKQVMICSDSFKQTLLQTFSRAIAMHAGHQI